MTCLCTGVLRHVGKSKKYAGSARLAAAELFRKEKDLHNKPKEALIHMSKRKALTWYQAWGIRLIAIVAALVVCAVITSLTTGLNPIEVYATMFAGAFGTTRRMWILGKEVAILLCISLALTPAFRIDRIGGYASECDPHSCKYHCCYRLRRGLGFDSGTVQGKMEHQ